MIIQANSEQLITFVLVDIDSVEVTGLGSTFTLEISKNGGAFAAGTGAKAEIGDGWYSYILTNNETNTPGPLSIRILGAGTVQQNLLHTIHFSSTWEPGEGPNILTVTEAATVLRCAEDDPNMLMLLPGIDAYIGMGTGWDWALDDPVNELAKNAARMLMKMWHEDPSMTGNQVVATLGPGFNAVMLQLKVLAMELLEEAGSA
jgi:hypothetical protein